MATGDKRKVKMVIQDYSGAFLGSQRFLKYKPSTLESGTVLLRHRGFLQKVLLQGMQGCHRLNLDQSPREGSESLSSLGKPNLINTAREQPPFYKYHHSCLHHYVPAGVRVP